MDYNNQNNNQNINPNGNKNNNRNNKPGWNLVVITTLMTAFMVLAISNFTGDSSKEISYGEFLEMVEKGEVEEVLIGSEKITITPKEKDGENTSIIPGIKTTYYTGYIENPNLIEQLESAGVKQYKAQESDTMGLMILNFMLTGVLPIVIMVGLMSILFKKMSKGGGGIMGVGKSNAKMYVQKETGVTFKDVAGQDEAKESLQEVVDFLHNPKKYTEIGAKLPKGALLVGPPGTGKTLLAKAVAGEAKVPFFSLSGSSFVETFVGVGASRVRDLFKEAVQKAPCIIFIDEIDAIGKSRDNQIQGNDEREQTLNQLLSEMDGFDSSKGIIILAATNRPEILDKALLRPGRFDRRVIVDRPDLKGREAILKVHAKDVCLDAEVDLGEIARGTPGAVGADLANIINEAALRAVKNGRKTVLQEDLREAVEVIIAGKEKKDRILSAKERKIVAFHEVGHALVATLLKHTDPVHKITIVPRTVGALGYTMQLPEEEKFLTSREEMYDQITVMLGGRSAEEEVFDLVSTGASNDIEKATQTARNMVTIYGMTDRFDMVGLESVQNRYLDGRAVRNCSEQTSTLIDEEILKIVKDAHKRARKLLKDNRDLLDKVSEVLLEKETLFSEEFMEIVCEKYPELKKPEKKEETAAESETEEDNN